MPGVFISYRTGDGEEAAALIGERLSDRFGAALVFRAARSIPPGAAFGQELLRAVRSSTVLLAVMGPGWSCDLRLREADDWVRREILTAFEQGVQVIPVLKGRKTDRLSKADLPAELTRLADVQSMRLDMASATADVNHIGDVLAELVPVLRAADRRASHPPNASAQQAAERGRSTIITGSHGPVHTGSGNNYQNSPHLSGDGAAYTAGDNHGGISHHFGGPPADRDDQ